MRAGWDNTDGDGDMTLRHSAPALAALAALLALAGPAAATNGYFSHGYSTAQRALGGAGTAYAADALAVAVNPASLVFLPERFDLNVGLFSPRRWYTAGPRGAGAGPGIISIEPGRQDSVREAFGIPALAYSRPLGPDQAWGIALYGNGGMNTDYREGSAHFAQGIPGGETQCAGTFGGGLPVAGASDSLDFCGNGATTASVDLIQLFVVPSYSHRVFDSSAVGVAPVIAAQRFTAKGLKAFAKFSNDPDRVSENGYSYSYGGGMRVGALFGEIPYLTLGASYQSRIYMTAFDEYAGLFADEGDFDIPSNWNAGAAIGIGTLHRVLVDYQRVNYSEIAAVGKPLDPNRFVNQCALPRLRGDTAASDACLGSANGPGFGWRDVGTLKLGYELNLGDLRLRSGYSRNRQPIPADEVLFNILAPGVPEEHYTAGFAWALGNAWGLEMSATYAKNNAVTGKNPLSNSTASSAQLGAELAVPGSGNTGAAFGVDPDDQDITLEMEQYEVMFGLSYSF
jgi:long-chain fatty acid transport protein